MKIVFMLITGILMITAAALQAQNLFQTDTISTSKGNLIINFIKHATLMLRFNGTVIHVDPAGMFTDYSKMPKADIILVTHEHSDHFDPAVIKLLMKENTVILLTKTCKDILKEGTIIKNGEEKIIQGIKIESFPAYNIVHKRDNGEPFHPKGIGNGYILTFGDKRLYIAGDTEDIPEMKNLKNIDIAFLPMNLPYTMTPKMVVHAADMFKPKILYPYHFGNTNTNELIQLMRDRKYCNVVVRNMN